MQGVVALLRSDELSRYDISFGLGLDPSTRKFKLQPNPADWTVTLPPTNRALIIFYTPSGSNTGPTNISVTVNISGVPTSVLYASYTRTTLAGCSALVRTSTGPAPGIGDWVLFPGQTLTFPINGESAYGEIKNQSGLSKVYPTHFGTYDITDMTNGAKWDTKLCTLDFSTALYTVLATAFFFNNGRNENFISFGPFYHYCPNPFVISTFYFATGIHSSFLFQGTVTEGSDLVQGTSDLTLNIAVSALTSVGTTATATCSTTFATILLLAANASQTITGAIFGATGATTAYNGSSYALTYVDATHFSYAFAGTGGAAATGTIQVSIRGDGYADAMASCDWVFVQCGFGYGSQSQGAHAGNLFLSGSVKRARNYEPIFMHGGWGRGTSRAAAPWNPGTVKTPITDLSHSSGVATALTPSTTGLSTGGYVLPGATTPSGVNSYNKLSKILSVTAGVSFTYSTDPASGAILGSATVTGYISGNTLNISSVVKGTVLIGQIVYGPGVGIAQCNITAGSGTTWTIDGATQTAGSSGAPVPFNCCATWVDPAVNGYDGNVGDPPDTFSHGKYIQNQVYDYREYDSITAWDCVNSKYTGGPIFLSGCVDFRGPRSFISDTLGNDTTANSGLGWSWPDGAKTTVLNHLQVFSDDVTYAGTHSSLLAESFGASLQGCAAGSTYSNALLLNASNPSGNNRFGVNGAATPGSPYHYTPALDMQHSVMSSWGPTDINTLSTGISKTYEFNITDDTTVLPAAFSSVGATTPNVSNLLLSSAQTAFRAGVTTTLTFDVANTLRNALPELASVTVGGSDIITEQNCLDYMLRNPGLTRWSRKVQQLWRQPIGR